MSDDAWEKMPQYLIKSFVLCRVDPNDRKISIQSLKKNLGCSNYCTVCGKCKIAFTMYSHSYYQP